ncbi:hypothetical protein C4D60_Mb05t07000 [Musa balbisiana]|uniref:Protein arginine N-methyltransferase domain-containing protein n=1 Tax=Musa balbisiana TaxID=52838 RepID=A0A4S8JUC2_MUSBA|nr:hypothetical protein C4D60_Mb05t07000 [Musa balbisiana]
MQDVRIDEKVDVIISDWMGDMLLHKLYMALFTDADGYRESIDFWHDVYGIDRGQKQIEMEKNWGFLNFRDCTQAKAHLGKNTFEKAEKVKEVDCYTITIQEFESVTNFSVSSLLEAPLHGFAFWFDVSFSGSATYSPNHHLQLPENPADRQAQGSSHSHWEQVPGELLLSTAPGEARTHWEQTVLYLYNPIELKQDQKMVGSVTLSLIKENCCLLDIHLAHSRGGLAHVETTIML